MMQELSVTRYLPVWVKDITAFIKASTILLLANVAVVGSRVRRA